MHFVSLFLQPTGDILSVSIFLCSALSYLAFANDGRTGGAPLIGSRKSPFPAAFVAVVPFYPLASYACQFAAGLYLSSTCPVHIQ